MIAALGDLLLDVIVRLEQPLAEGADADAVTGSARGGPGGERGGVDRRARRERAVHRQARRATAPARPLGAGSSATAQRPHLLPQPDARRRGGLGGAVRAGFVVEVQCRFDGWLRVGRRAAAVNPVGRVEVTDREPMGWSEGSPLTLVTALTGPTNRVNGEGTPVALDRPGGRAAPDRVHPPSPHRRRNAHRVPRVRKPGLAADALSDALIAWALAQPDPVPA